MATNGFSGADFNFALLMPGSERAASRLRGFDRAAAPGAADAFSSVLLRVAEFQSQMFSVLTGSAFAADDAKTQQSLGDLLAALNASTTSPTPAATETGIGGLSPTGRNMALFDPESAFRMMSRINKDEVDYKAQFAELSAMQSELAEIGGEAQELGEIGVAAGSASVRSAVLAFAGEYNEWVRRFDEAMENGGILAGTQAAQVSRYELEQSVGSIFNGAAAGLHGLQDLGLTIDPASRLAVVDTAKLDAVLLGNPQGAVAALHEFGRNFAKSAEMLNSDGNFVPNRLGNLDRVIDYIDEHKASLQVEFGLGDPARPSPVVAAALANYQQILAL